MKLIWVDPGSFQMGSNNSSGYFSHPIHKVDIRKGYWIGECEVTEHEYEEITGYKGSDRGRRMNLPRSSVSWSSAMEFCKKLTSRELRAGRLPMGYEYSLPSETQWEYAARGGKKTQGFEYSGSDKFSDVGSDVYAANSRHASYEVGQKKTNELGIHDMSGNLYEWCRDKWHSSYDGAPSDDSAWDSHSMGDDISRSRVVRIYSITERTSLDSGTSYHWVGFRISLVEKK